MGIFEVGGYWHGQGSIFFYSSSLSSVDLTNTSDASMSNPTLVTFGFMPTYEYAPAFLPSAGQTIHEFRQPGQSSEVQGPLVKVVLHNDGSWYGVFQDGDAALAQAYCGPSPDHLCMIAKGAGYIVPVAALQKYVVVRAKPIVQVDRIPGRDMLILSDYSNIAAYDERGMGWLAEGVSLDGISLSRITSEYIDGIAAGDDTSPAVPFRVDVSTGHVEGGFVGSLRQTHRT